MGWRRNVDISRVLALANGSGRKHEAYEPGIRVASEARRLLEKGRGLKCLDRTYRSLAACKRLSFRRKTLASILFKSSRRTSNNGNAGRWRHQRSIRGGCIAIG